MEQDNLQQLTKKERKQLVQEQKRQEYQKKLNRAVLKTRMKKLSMIAIGVLVFSGVVFGLLKFSSSASAYPYVVGKPGIGEKAPEFSLESTTGGNVTLSDYKGKTVLLYIQEGLMCQACWRQQAELERDIEKFKKELGVDQIVTITIDPIGSLIQKARTDGYKLPVLSDRDAKVSLAYDALKYGMMDGAYPGHTFILVGPDSTIKWRADYGGTPKYTMYLPNDQIIKDMNKDLNKQ